MISPNSSNVCVILYGSAYDIDADNNCGNSEIVSYTWLVDGLEAGTGPAVVGRIRDGGGHDGCSWLSAGRHKREKAGTAAGSFLTPFD